jgi:hypothetical protein
VLLTGRDHRQAFLHQQPHRHHRGVGARREGARSGRLTHDPDVPHGRLSKPVARWRLGTPYNLSGVLRPLSRRRPSEPVASLLA